LNSWNVLCLFPTKFSKTRLQIFSCQNRKSELSIDGLIISVPFLTFGVRKRQKFFVKWVKKCTLSALLNFASLHSWKFFSWFRMFGKVWSKDGLFPPKLFPLQFFPLFWERNLCTMHNQKQLKLNSFLLLLFFTFFFKKVKKSWPDYTKKS